MKRIYLMLVVVSLCMNISAKTTYIPFYFGKISIDEGKSLVNDSSRVRDFMMKAPNGKYSISILHDSITAERIKLIKDEHLASNFTEAIATLSMISTLVKPLGNACNIRRYSFSRSLMYSSTMASIIQEEEDEAEQLEHLDICIIIENYSDKEISINDMNRGLIWFIPPYSDLTITLGNPEINSFRVSSVNPFDQDVNYVTIQAGNYLKKFDIDYEDDEIWFIPLYTKERSPYDNDYEFLGYERRNKVTMESETFSREEGKKILKQLKQKKK